MQITNLGGHSGCKVLLCETPEKEVFVRKISNSLDYNDRLKFQCEKQKDFFCKLGEGAAVLNSGYTSDNLFFFDMEYIKGVTLCEYIKTVETTKIGWIVDFLIRSINPAKYKNNEKFVAKQEINQSFFSKITDLEKKLYSLNNEIVNNAIELLKSHNWSNFMPSPCHGDLTFENIIVKNDKLYFIDFLDSFYDSYLIDLGTIYQDALVMWSFRDDDLTSSSIVRLIIFKDILTDRLNKILGTDILDVSFSLLLKLVRIYPYVKDRKTLSFLNEKINLVIKKIDQGISL